MNHHPPESDVMSTRLLELERLLVDETAALKRLDREAIDRLSREKLAVAEALKQLGAANQAHQVVLERIQRRALMNQLLLVNARDCLRGVLELATGSAITPSYGGDRSPAARPRLDIRG